MPGPGSEQDAVRHLLVTGFVTQRLADKALERGDAGPSRARSGAESRPS